MANPVPPTSSKISTKEVNKAASKVDNSVIPYTASMLYSLAKNLPTQGQWRCHWCGGPCTDRSVHDDPPPIPFVRSKSTAKCPSEPYACQACLRWQKSKHTIKFIGGINGNNKEFKDGQIAANHSWFITEEEAYAIRRGDLLDMARLWELLLSPPRRFVLSLRLDDDIQNLLQLCHLNDPGGIVRETVFFFTVNNIPHTYSIYELEEAIRNGPGIYGPGVRSLFSWLGEPEEDLKKKYPPQKEEEDQRGRGRPAPKKDTKYTTRQTILASGAPNHPGQQHHK